MSAGRTVPLPFESRLWGKPDTRVMEPFTSSALPKEKQDRVIPKKEEQETKQVVKDQRFSRLFQVGMSNWVQNKNHARILSFFFLEDFQYYVSLCACEII